MKLHLSDMTLARAEEALLIEALLIADLSKVRAAEIMGITRNAVVRRMDKHGLTIRNGALHKAGVPISRERIIPSIWPGLPETLSEVERRLIVEALKQAGSYVDAAQLLGITRHALVRRVIKHRVAPYEWKGQPELVEAPGKWPDPAPRK